MLWFVLAVVASTMDSVRVEATAGLVEFGVHATIKLFWCFWRARRILFTSNRSEENGEIFER